MCTVSYIPLSVDNKHFIVTDNRDESINRPAAFPQVYREFDTQLFYPKDKIAGGTWFGMSDRRQMMCLMNGAFFKHKRQNIYRKSRGVVVKELVSRLSIDKAVSNYNFEGIEPFFAVVFCWREKLIVFELIWDGQKIYRHHKDEKSPYIWSSAMTYTETQRMTRESEFDNFVQKPSNLNMQSIWDYHHNKGNGTEDIVIDRGELKTTSVFQITNVPSQKQVYRYEDLLKEEEVGGQILWKS